MRRGATILYSNCHQRVCRPSVRSFSLWDKEMEGFNIKPGGAIDDTIREFLLLSLQSSPFVISSRCREERTRSRWVFTTSSSSLCLPACACARVWCNNKDIRILDSAAQRSISNIVITIIGWWFSRQVIVSCCGARTCNFLFGFCWRGRERRSFLPPPRCVPIIIMAKVKEMTTNKKEGEEAVILSFKSFRNDDRTQRPRAS